MSWQHSHLAHHFDPSLHLHRRECDEWIQMHDSLGRTLEGIRGRAGVVALDDSGLEIGIDVIELQPGSGFELHTHVGCHVIFVLSGLGIVHIEHSDYSVREGDSVFIPPNYPHLMKAAPEAGSPFRLAVLSYPHRHLAARDRVNVFTEPGADLE